MATEKIDILHLRALDQTFVVTSCKLKLPLSIEIETLISEVLFTTGTVTRSIVYAGYIYATFIDFKIVHQK